MKACCGQHNIILPNAVKQTYASLVFLRAEGAHREVLPITKEGTI